MSFKVVTKIEKWYSKNITLFFEGEIDVCDCISNGNQLFMKNLIAKKCFTGKKGEHLDFSFFEGESLVELTYIGIGKKEEFCRNQYRFDLYGILKDLSGEVSIYSKEEELADEEIMAEVIGNINYNFDKYISNSEKKTLNVELFKENYSKEFIEAEILEEIVSSVKDMVNEPANIITPTTLAERAVDLGETFGFQVEILDEFRASELGMEAFLAVGRASANRPKLIVMRYLGDPENPNKKIGIIGKGLTYDTGGLSIKPTDSMLNMKDDMAGAATAIGILGAAAKFKVKKNIIGVIAACENSIGSKAYRPGDILKTMSGKTIEVTNTDAEGRITLADAMTYAAKIENVTEIIDIATLTGAMVVALGNDVTGVFSNCDENYLKLEKASKNWNEKYWRMPLVQEYDELIKSDIADLKNSAGRWGGAITAAKFLEHFTEGLPWMHLDIAGTSFSEKNGNWYKKGATGTAVKTLYYYLKN